MNYQILFAYDSDIENYEADPNFRLQVIKFLLINGAKNLSSCVASTITFNYSSNSENPFSYWEDLIENEFEDFYYELTLIQAYNNDLYELSSVSKSKHNFVKNFELMVTSVKNSLITEGIQYLDT